MGNYLGGKFADRSVTGTLKGFLTLLIAIMIAIPWLARNEFGAAIAMVVWGAATFAVVPPLQMRVMRVAHEAPGLSSSVNIGAFNPGTPGCCGGRRRHFWRSGIQLCAGDGGDYCRARPAAGDDVRPETARSRLHGGIIKITQKGNPFCVSLTRRSSSRRSPN